MTGWLGSPPRRHSPTRPTPSPPTFRRRSPLRTAPFSESTTLARSVAEPVLVRIVETAQGESASIDGRPVLIRGGETAREAALRTVIDETISPRRVDVHTPAGVVLHVTAEPGGHLQVLGQSAAPRADVDPQPRDPDQAPTSRFGTAHEPAGDADSSYDWPERDLPWPVPVDAADPPESAVHSAEVWRERTAPPVATGDSTDDAATPEATSAVATATGASSIRRRGASLLVGKPRARTRRPSLPSPMTARRSAVAALVVTLAGAGVLGAVTILDGAGAPGQAAPTVMPAGASAQPFPGALPDGVEGDVAWTGPALLADSQAAVVPLSAAEKDQAVALITADRQLVVVDAATGRSRWSAPLPAGVVTRGPGATRVGGHAAIALQVGTHVLIRAASDGTPLTDVTVPDGARLSLDGLCPLVLIGPTEAGLIDRTGLRTVTVPTGSRALAAREDGTILAAAARGWWHLGPGHPAGPVTPWEQMSSAADGSTQPLQVVGALGSAVVLLDPDKAGQRILVHDDGAAARASFQGASVAAQRATWAPSPSDTWGVLGRSLVDMKSGDVTDLGDWRTVLVTDDRAYGLIGENLHVVRPGGVPAPVQTRTALVEATAGDGVLVRATTDAGSRVWMMRRSTT